MCKSGAAVNRGCRYLCGRFWVFPDFPGEIGPDDTVGKLEREWAILGFPGSLCLFLSFFAFEGGFLLVDMLCFVPYI